VAAHVPADPAIAWLDYLKPFSAGLVVAPQALRDLGLPALPQHGTDTKEVASLIDPEKEDSPSLPDPWAFFERILGWEARHVAGSPGGPGLPDELVVRLPEYGTTLQPTWAVKELGGDKSWQLLVRFEVPGVNPDARGALEGWEATAHQRFERLLRETNVPAGLLITDKVVRTGSLQLYVPELRLVHAPKGETSGWLGFPLRPLATVAGRPMLGGLKLVLDRARLFTDADGRRLPAILKASRDKQAGVSTALAEQVLGALHELLRGLDSADSDLVHRLAQERSGHLYEGLLGVLMRLVFILYAEDRDLLPSLPDARAKDLYEQSYSLRGLYAKLVDDAALNPDTMDERRGGWGRLLALFRLIYRGHPSGFVQARGGGLFDPDAFPFLEGRAEAGDPPRVLTVSDGCVLRILEGLMTVQVRGQPRERVSYRTLDVEQIGSVYETVMGFQAEPAPGRVLAIKAGKNNRTPVFVDLDALAARKGEERIKALKEQAGRSQLSANQAQAIKAAGSVAELAAALDPIVDERGSPKRAMAAAGTPVLQPTDERRRTGSHYTPRSLTEPIVRHALEPALERLGEDATPADVLDLKVCDPAMGSGAFLVEACRQIGARLVTAWARHGGPPPMPADETPELHARRLVAQRCLYGVDKNPRAVDLAKLSLWLATLARDHEFTFLDHALKEGDSLVGLTKAQIAATHWDASKPPTFVGSLVADHLREAEEGRARIRERAEWESEAELRRRLRAVDVKLEVARLIGDGVVAAFFAADKPKKRLERLVELQKAIQSHLLSPRWADAMASHGASLAGGEHPVRPFHWEIEFPEVFAHYSTTLDGEGPGVRWRRVDEESGGGTPSRSPPPPSPPTPLRKGEGRAPGFDAIVGNPPFAGKNTVAAGNRAGYGVWLQGLHEGAHGNADLVAHFFRRAYGMLKPGGAFGLIATNTIGQGDTRASGLTAILGAGGAIMRATRRLKWPGEAAVVVSVVHVVKGPWRAPVLDGRQVRRVSAYLVEGDLDVSPEPLAVNNGKAFQGSIVLGMGFTFDEEAAKKGVASSLDEMRRLIEADARNADRIKPYIGGEEVNNHPRQAHDRYIIDFEDMPLKREQGLSYWASMGPREREQCLRTGVVPADYAGPVAANWPDLLKTVEAKVKPERAKIKDAIGRAIWWRFLRSRPELQVAAATLPRLLATARVSPFLIIAQLGRGVIYSDQLIIFAYPDLAPFAVLQSRAHELWARFFSSSMKDDLRYTPSDCFRTFPFPPGFEIDPALEAAGEAHHAHRAALMIARNEGLTKTYNRFHARAETAPDIVRLRDLHAAMDAAVLAAYGWDDLAQSAAPEFIEQEADEGRTPKTRLDWPAAFRDEVLARLLALNAERAKAEREAGLSPAVVDDDDGIDEDEAA